MEHILFMKLKFFYVFSAIFMIFKFSNLFLKQIGPTNLNLKCSDIYSSIVLRIIQIAYPFENKRYTISKLIKVIGSLRNAHIFSKSWN